MAGKTLLIAELKANYQVDDQAGADTEGQAQDIDDACNFIPQEVSPGNFEIVSEHSNQKYS